MIQPLAHARRAVVIGIVIVVAECGHAIMLGERGETKNVVLERETYIVLDRKMTTHDAQSQRVNHVG